MRLTERRVEEPGGEAAALDVAQREAVRARGGDRRLAAEPREGQCAARIDLADPRRLDLGALREVPEALHGRTRVEAVHEPDRVAHAGLLHEQPLERVDAGVEVRVD